MIDWNLFNDNIKWDRYSINADWLKDFNPIYIDRLKKLCDDLSFDYYPPGYYDPTAPKIWFDRSNTKILVILFNDLIKKEQLNDESIKLYCFKALYTLDEELFYRKADFLIENCQYYTTDKSINLENFDTTKWSEQFNHFFGIEIAINMNNFNPLEAGVCDVPETENAALHRFLNVLNVT